MTRTQLGRPRLGSRADAWEFGGYPYGLEPLLLPLRPPRPVREPESSSVPEQEVASIANLVDTTVPELEPHDEDDQERVFWFRWITGHQISFLCWQLLDSALADFASGGDRDTALDRMRCHVRGYSLMLLYSGTCPRSRYDRVIRTPMCRHHRYLTGLWARDYSAAVRGLLHGRVELGDGPRSAAVAAECLLNERVHEGIAKKLVPHGPSLLQAVTEAEGRTFQANRDRLLTLYDCTFITVRQNVSHDDLVAQLLRRLRAVVMDIGTNGFFPDWAPGSADEMAQLGSTAIADCLATTTESIMDIARAAVEAGYRRE